MILTFLYGVFLGVIIGVCILLLSKFIDDGNKRND